MKVFEVPYSRIMLISAILFVILKFFCFQFDERTEGCQQEETGKGQKADRSREDLRQHQSWIPAWSWVQSVLSRRFQPAAGVRARRFSLKAQGDQAAERWKVSAGVDVKRKYKYFFTLFFLHCSEETQDQRGGCDQRCGKWDGRSNPGSVPYLEFLRTIYVPYLKSICYRPYTGLGLICNPREYCFFYPRSFLSAGYLGYLAFWFRSAGFYFWYRFVRISNFYLYSFSVWQFMGTYESGLDLPFICDL